MNKKQAQARATELGIEWVTRDTAAVLRSRIEQAEKAADATVDAGLTGAVESVIAGADPVETADALVAAVKATRGGKAKGATKTKPATKKATTKKTSKAAGDNPAIAKLVEAIDTGDFGIALMHRDLTPGKLARQLEVEPAVVAKIASGKRVPRTNAPADSIAGRLAAWYLKETA